MSIIQRMPTEEVAKLIRKKSKTGELKMPRITSTEIALLVLNSGMSLNEVMDLTPTQCKVLIDILFEMKPELYKFDTSVTIPDIQVKVVSGFSDSGN